MKKLVVSLSLIVCSTLSVLAQIEKTVAVKEEEVPVAVRIAFENDFHIAPEADKWNLTYEISSEGSKSIAKPLVYSYAKKENGEKIKIQYTPEGKLKSFKGIEKAIESTSTTDNKEKS